MPTFNWFCSKQDLEKRKVLEQILPQEYNYRVTEFKIKSEGVTLNETKFTAKVSVNICDKQEIGSFLREFKEISNTDYNQELADTTWKTTQISGRRKCIHKVKKSKKNEKDKRTGMNTDCGASLKFRLKKVDPHVHQADCDLFPFELHINYDHNHSVDAASAFKYHCVSQSTKLQFEEMFREGHSASSAYSEYKNRLKCELDPEAYIRVLADRSIMPDYRWCFHYFSTFMSRHFGAINSPDTYKRASEFIDNYNARNHGLFAKIMQYETGDFIVAVCDPLSQRVHEFIPAAGDICFVDATSFTSRN